METLEISNMPYTLIKGSWKLPDNAEVVYPKAVINNKNSNIGVLLKFDNTGMYALFTCGSISSVPQAEARKIATNYESYCNSHIRQNDEMENQRKTPAKEDDFCR